MLLSLHKLFFLSFLTIWFSAFTAFGQTVVYVTPVGGGNYSGSSWANAVRSDGLQARLAAASSGTQFWIARGTYNPSSYAQNNRLLSFIIPSGVQVYGGFEGNESSLSDRTLTQPSSTTFSGELGNPSDVEDNVFHVVTFMNASPSTRLDGVVVTRGRGLDGAGIFNNGSGAGNRSDPTIANCYITDNVASYGGGIYNGGYQGSANPVITNCIISRNRAYTNGGGVYNNGYQGQCNPVFTNCLSFSNVAADGGAYYNEAFSGTCNPVFNNCTIAINRSSRSYFDNATPYGSGAMYNDLPGNQGTCNPVLTNCLVWGNTAEFAPNSTSSIYNNGSINLTISYSTTQDGYAGTGNDSNNPNLLTDFRLSPNSSAIDSGDPSSTTATVSGLDADFKFRIRNNRIDRGAIEYRLRYGAGFRVYVSTSGAGDFSGSSWENAVSERQFPDLLTDALTGTEFWIATGIYKPTTATNRSRNFQIVSGVRIYGGFTGTETNSNQRNLATNPTVLSGDIGVQGDNADNVYNVINFSETSATPLLDGLTITGGNANGSYQIERSATGGGIYIGKSSPVIENCLIEANYGSSGGGIYLNSNGSSSSVVQLRNCVIRNNKAIGGGGINVNTYSFRKLMATACVIESNTATNAGGGAYNGYTVEFVSCLFKNNMAASGGALISGTIQGVVTNSFKNCTIVGNVATSQAGGIYASQGFGSGNTTIVNSIIRDNTAPNSSNLFFDGGVNTITYSNIQGGFTGTGNIDADPLFVDPANGNFRLQPGSPSINTGDPNSTTANVSATDLAGNPRVENGRIDMGAYERQTAIGPIVTLKEGNWNDPTTWLFGQIPVAGDTILIKHRVGMPASYVGNARTVQYDANGQLVFSPAARLLLN